jgi:hypothetical protein
VGAVLRVSSGSAFGVISRDPKETVALVNTPASNYIDDNLIVTVNTVQTGNFPTMLAGYQLRKGEIVYISVSAACSLSCYVDDQLGFL